MIHFREEGEWQAWGINLVKNERSVFIISILIPYWRTDPHKYWSDYFDILYWGSKIRCFNLYFRLRKWWGFPKDIQKFVFHFEIGEVESDNWNFLCSREIMEDNTVTGY